MVNAVLPINQIVELSNLFPRVPKCKIVKPKFKSEKINKKRNQNKTKLMPVLKGDNKKRQNRHNICYVTFK